MNKCKTGQRLPEPGGGPAGAGPGEIRRPGHDRPSDHKPIGIRKKTGTQNMKKIQDTEDYPAVHSWSYITIEGYCMLNMEYRMCHHRYNHRLNPDRTFTRIKNERYDPKRKPDPYPGDCKRSVRSSCIECRHFGWCDPDDENHEEKTGKNEMERRDQGNGECIPASTAKGCLTVRTKR